MATSTIPANKGVNQTGTAGSGVDLDDLQGGNTAGNYNVSPGASNPPTASYSSLFVGSHMQIAATKYRLLFRQHAGNPLTWGPWRELIPLWYKEIDITFPSGATDRGVLTVPNPNDYPGGTLVSAFLSNATTGAAIHVQTVSIGTNNLTIVYDKAGTGEVPAKLRILVIPS